MRVLRLIDEIKSEEGLVLHPYFDHLGVPSIGYGTTYWDGQPITMNWRTISKRKALVMLYAKLMESIVDAAASVANFEGLTNVRQECLTEMAYQMGGRGLRRWKKSIGFINDKRWQKAHDEMLDSALYRDEKTRARAIKYAEMILSGE